MPEEQYPLKRGVIDGLKFVYRDNTSDYDTMLSILRDDEYKLNKLDIKDGIFLDAGAHIGGFSLAMANRGFNGIAIEMIPENVDLLIKNLEMNGFADKVKVINGAICNRLTSPVAYYSGLETSTGKIHKFIGTIVPRFGIVEDGIPIPVNPVTPLDLDIIFEGRKCCYFKMDIETAEWELFKAHPIFLESTDIICGEIHSQFKGGVVRHEDLLGFLDGKFVDQSEIYEPLYSKPGIMTHFLYRRIEI